MFIIDEDFDRGALRSFAFGRNTRPLLAIQRIMQALLPVSTPFELQPDERFEFCDTENNANILLLLEGTGVVCHSENNMAITTLFSPSVLGLIDGYSTFYDVEARPKHFSLRKHLALVNWFRLLSLWRLWTSKISGMISPGFWPIGYW